MATTLAACSDPLSGFDKLSDVDVIVEDPVRVALADPALEQAEQGGVFGRLFRRAPVEPAAEVDETDGAALPQSTDVAEAEDLTEMPVADVKPEKRRLLGGLFKKPATPEPAPLAAEPDVTRETDAPAEAAVLADAPALNEAPAKKGGLLGLLRRKDNAPEKINPDPVEVASLDPEPFVPVEQARVPAPKRGLLGGLRKKAAGAGGEADVSYGTRLPFGQVARVCEARLKPMGRRIEKAGKGKGFVLYDSAPESTAPRTFYVTGFGDGCPRQFTAALALFGAPSMHEQLRYGSPSEQYPYSATDKAYEKVKARVCGSARRKPCGSKIKSLERNTVFISTYERFSDNGRWADILLHSGAVMASAIKAPY